MEETVHKVAILENTFARGEYASNIGRASRSRQSSGKEGLSIGSSHSIVKNTKFTYRMFHQMVRGWTLMLVPIASIGIEELPHQVAIIPERRSRPDPAPSPMAVSPRGERVAKTRRFRWRSICATASPIHLPISRRRVTRCCLLCWIGRYSLRCLVASSANCCPAASPIAMKSSSMIAINVTRRALKPRIPTSQPLKNCWLMQAF